MEWRVYECIPSVLGCLTPQCLGFGFLFIKWDSAKQTRSEIIAEANILLKSRDEVIFLKVDTQNCIFICWGITSCFPLLSNMRLSITSIFQKP